MFRRSDSFTSICSCSTDPPEISVEDEGINLESYQQIDSYQELEDYNIPINPELDFVQVIPTVGILGILELIAWVIVD